MNNINMVNLKLQNKKTINSFPIFQLIRYYEK